jgi:hypothetical protein
VEIHAFVCLHALKLQRNKRTEAKSFGLFWLFFFFFFVFFFFFFLVALGFELRALCLRGRCSTRAHLQSFLGYFRDGVSLSAHAGLRAILLFMLPMVAGITDLHLARILVEMGSHQHFCPCFLEL